jgi:hypothetical protein
VNEWISEYAWRICEIEVVEETEVPVPDQLSPLQNPRFWLVWGFYPGLRGERPVPKGVGLWEWRHYVLGV